MKYLFLVIPIILCYMSLHDWKYMDNKNRLLSVLVCPAVIAVTYYIFK